MSKPFYDIRTFLGGMNSDDSDAMIPKDDYRSARNSNIGWSDDDDLGTVENVKGTSRVTTRDMSLASVSYEDPVLFELPAGDNLCIGREHDPKNQRIVFFVWNSQANHCICAYNIQENNILFILENEPVLNFQRDPEYRITFIDIIDDLLLWTDNYNDPRCINMVRAAKYTQQKIDVDIYQRPLRFTGSVNPRSFFVSQNQPFTSANMAVHLDDPDGILFQTFMVGTTIENKDKFLFFIRFDDPDRWEHNGECKIVSVKTPVAGKVLVVFDRKRFSDESCSGTIYHYFGEEQYYGITNQTLNRIVYQPDKVPTVSYDQDETRKSNFLRGKLFTFRIRYQDLDYGYSCWSEFSQVAYPMGDQLLNGHYILDTTVNNRLNVWFKTGTEHVRQIEIAKKEGSEGLWALVERVNKFDEDGTLILPSFVENPYFFYNDIQGEGLDQNEMVRLYDNVPLKCGIQELISNNRLMDGNILEGFDNIKTDIDLSLTYNDVKLPTILNPMNTHKSWGCNEEFRGLQAEWDRHYVPWFTGEVNTLWVVEVIVFPWDESGVQPPFDEWIFCRVFVYPKPGEDIGTIVDEIHRQTQASFPDKILTFHGSIAPPHNCKSTSWNQIKYNWRTDGYRFHTVETKVYYMSQTYQSHKANSLIYPGIVYFDEAGRSGGVNRDNNTKIAIPHLSDFTPFFPNTIYDPHDDTKFNCYKQIQLFADINHIPPAWAKYYEFYVAKYNPYFVYALASMFLQEDGKVYFNVNYFLDSMFEENNSSSIKPYEWERGDRIRLLGVKPRYSDQFALWFQHLDFEILGETWDDVAASYKTYYDGQHMQDDKGNYVYRPALQKLYIDDFNPSNYNIQLTGPGAVGPSDEVQVIAEIYRPAKPLTDDKDQMMYYGTGKYYDIGNPGQVNAYHKGGIQDQVVTPGGVSTTPARCKIDCENVFLKLRIWFNGSLLFPVEDDNFSDYYASDLINTGRVNKYFFDAEQRRYGGKLQITGAYMEGTKINYLGRSDAKDSHFLTEKWLNITGFKELGYTVKVLQGEKATSIYIGKVGLMQAGGEGEIRATTSNIFGDINVSEEIYGCLHPESIVQVGRSICFYDFLNSTFVRDFANGQQDITAAAKYTNAFRELTDTIRDVGYENVLVITTYDSKYKRLFIHFVDDSLGLMTHIETLCYSLTRNRFVVNFDFKNIAGQGVDTLIGVESKLILFSKGVPYLCEVNENRGEFIDAEWDQEIEMVFNISPGDEKVYHGLGYKSQKVWEVPEITIPPSANYVNGMFSRLLASKFRRQEGNWYAAFMRNMLSSSSTPLLKDLATGDLLSGNSIKVKLKNSYREKVNLLLAVVHGLIG